MHIYIETSLYLSQKGWHWSTAYTAIKLLMRGRGGGNRCPVFCHHCQGPKAAGNGGGMPSTFPKLCYIIPVFARKLDPNHFVFLPPTFWACPKALFWTTKVCSEEKTIGAGCLTMNNQQCFINILHFTMTTCIFDKSWYNCTLICFTETFVCLKIYITI